MWDGRRLCALPPRDEAVVSLSRSSFELKRVWRCNLQLCIDRAGLQVVTMDASCLIETGRNSTDDGDFVILLYDANR